MSEYVITPKMWSEYQDEIAGWKQKYEDSCVKRTEEIDKLFDLQNLLITKDAEIEDKGARIEVLEQTLKSVLVDLEHAKRHGTLRAFGMVYDIQRVLFSNSLRGKVRGNER